MLSLLLITIISMISTSTAKCKYYLSGYSPYALGFCQVDAYTHAPTSLIYSCSSDGLYFITTNYNTSDCTGTPLSVKTTNASALGNSLSCTGDNCYVSSYYGGYSSASCTSDTGAPTYGYSISTYTITQCVQVYDNSYIWDCTNDSYSIYTYSSSDCTGSYTSWTGSNGCVIGDFRHILNCSKPENATSPDSSSQRFMPYATSITWFMCIIIIWGFML